MNEQVILLVEDDPDDRDMYCLLPNEPPPLKTT